MFSKIGTGEIILIVGVALLIFGPSKLPELGKSLGKSIRDFKGAMKETSDSLTAGAASDVMSVKEDLTKTVNDVKSSVNPLSK